MVVIFDMAMGIIEEVEIHGEFLSDEGFERRVFIGSFDEDLVEFHLDFFIEFLGIFEHGSWTYTGHDTSNGASLEEISNYLESCQTQLTEGLLKIGNDMLSKKVLTLHGHEVSAWRILMSIPEHEIHHRGQISAYLQMNNIEPPQIFGLKIEQVKTL